MRIALGSTNPVKCNATRAVLTRLYPDAELVYLDVPSGVSDQLWGDRETRQSAYEIIIRLALAPFQNPI